MRALISFFIFVTCVLFSSVWAESCNVGGDDCMEDFIEKGTNVLKAFLGEGNIIKQNALVKNTTTCPSMAVIFARGTAEPGNVGILTGPPFFAAMAAYMNGTNQLAVQGVDYPADVVGFLAGGSQEGADKMASLINSTMTKCPGTPILLSGYSQGAQVVHLATASLPSNTTSKIASVVLFGDPKNGTALTGVDAAKVMTICHSGDDICKGGNQLSLSHLNYSSDANAAAMFALGSAAPMLGITSQKLRADNSLG